MSPESFGPVSNEFTNGPVLHYICSGQDRSVSFHAQPNSKMKSKIGVER